MFGMIPHMKALALSQCRLLMIIVAEQKRQMADGPEKEAYISATAPLEKEMETSLRNLGIIR